MENIDRRLIELNDALLRMSTYKTPAAEQMLTQAQSAVSGITIPINTGPGNDTVVVNTESDCDCECPPGPQGEKGDQGEPGPKGDKGDKGDTGSFSCNKITISDNYQAKCSDWYIGVAAVKPVTITLPADCTDQCEIVIKAEMGPPLGNRKVTIVPYSDDSTFVNIDGNLKIVLEVPYASVRLVYNNGNWWTV